MLRKSYAITPNDGADLPDYITELYVGGAGDIALELSRDTAPVTLKAVPVGTIIKGLLIRKILATGTTATFLVGFHGG